MDAVNFEIKGIKCDNPDCDYEDMEAEFIPDKYLNAPCPKCSSNLFTQEDYDKMKFMMDIASVINNHYQPNPNDKVLGVELKMDGSGKIGIGDIEIKER